MNISNIDSFANMEDFIDVLRVRFECMRLNDDNELEEGMDLVETDVNECMEIDNITNMDKIANMEDFIDVLRVRFECVRLNDGNELEEDMERGETDVNECMDIDFTYGQFADFNQQHHVDDIYVTQMDTTECFDVECVAISAVTRTE